jgi:hypothetical protein
MSKLLLPVMVVTGIFAFGCNSDTNRNSVSNVQSVPTGTLTPAGQVNTPSSSRAGIWLKANEGNYVNIDSLARIDFEQNKATLLIAQNGHLVSISDSFQITSPEDIQRVRDAINGAADHWAGIQVPSGPPPAKELWVNLDNVTDAMFSPDGVYHLSAEKAYLGKVLPTEIPKVKKYLGIQ